MHVEAYAYVARTVRRLQAVPGWSPGRVVEVGSLDINGSVRALFSSAREYVGVDRVGGRGVDVVADGATWRPEEPVDTVVCCEVLEHAREAEAVVANMGAMLRPGGVAIVTCAGPGRAPHSAVDGGQLREGEWYANVSLSELESWVRRAGLTLQHGEHHSARGDTYLLARKGA